MTSPDNSSDLHDRCLIKRRLHTGVACTLIIALAVSFLGAGPAVADPDGPSKQDVRESKQDVDERAADVQRTQDKLEQARQSLDKLREQAEVLVEKYNGARVKLDRAKNEYDAARQRLQEAEAKLDRTRDKVGTVAATVYKRGTSMPRLASTLSADGPRDLINRLNAMKILANQRSTTLDEMRSAKIVAGVLREQAHQAWQEQREATKEAERAKRAAQAKVQEQKSQVGEIKDLEQRLEAKLDQARSHAQAVQKAREEYLERQRRLRLRRQRERARQQAARERAQERAQEQAEQAQRSDDGPDSATSGGGSSSSEASGGSDTSSNFAAAGEIAADWALTQLGKPYEWAADGPATYDCSGLTMRAWQHAGASLPHWSVGQYYQSNSIPLDQLRQGDLIFYAHDTSDPDSIHHVGIYIGDGKMVEAPYTGATVRISSIHVWDDLIGAARP